MSAMLPDWLPQPPAFPIGSAESRAAARAMADRKIKSLPRIEFFNLDRNGESMPTRTVADSCIIEFLDSARDEVSR
jgi:hypothetical protein